MRTQLKTENCKLKTNQGQAMLIATIFFLAVAVSTMLGVAVPALNQNKNAEDLLFSRQSQVVSESGIEDVIYRIKNNKQVSSTEVLSIASSTATTTISVVGSNEKGIDSTGNASSRVKKTTADVTVISGSSFNYGVQSGNGGFLMENNSDVVGNIYSNGSVVGQNSNLVKGDVVSAGASGSVDGIHATSSIYAHTISNSTADKDAYYQTISNTTVHGTKYPNSVDKPTAAMPISDSLVSQWEADAVSGGTINSPCPYTIKDDVTIGPVKINCDLEISGNNYTITLTGTVWVAGDISVKNSPTFKIANSLGKKSIAIIADKPNDHSTGSTVTLENSAGFVGNGDGSYVLVLSQNSSSENGGGTVAIDLQNGAQGDLLLYAGHGEILLENSGSLKEVTAYKVHLKNSAEVKYSTGLADMLFTSGPSGSWSIKSWKASQ